MNIDMNQFSEIKEGEKVSEERYSTDRNMYQRGRVGYPELPSESLSERDRACYMMGYSASEAEDSYV